MFTKILVVLMAHLHTKGIAPYPYLDDILLRAPSFRLAQEHLQETIRVLQYHGFAINWVKSHLLPCQSLEHLGAVIDAKSHRMFLLEERRVKMHLLLQQVQQAPR